MTGAVRRLLSTDIDGTIVFDRAISPADAYFSVTLTSANGSP